MQVPSSKDVGDALGFGSAFLFTSIFGMPSVLVKISTTVFPI